MIDFLEIVFVNLFFIFVTIAIFLIINRLRVGPSLADRVVALDLFASLLLSAIAVGAIYMIEPLYMDVALVLAILSFIGTVVFARFIDDQGKQARSPARKDGR